MPAGVSWGQYIRFFVAAMLSMAAGSQAVHMYYKPLKDLDVYISRELEQEKSLKSDKQS
ncbi:ubiquinol-cytochrome-c reductase complex assembly factor 6 [Phlebotomus argentipes]|uniref:ubiquinol-cytochrome-c reductase complex assembly factor 6 n=1 Tax=Phlebotomus argentipes TaxID=94469 RepID=UPI002892B024|nr:ubiquinol-cytochrome-c reductase complex assembly factor 6 [Phlebotomus argentipes]